MNRDEILNMPAGQEMDAMILERIFHMSVDDNFYLSHFSTSIIDSWSVVENFYSMTFDRWSNGKEFRCYLVTGRDGKNCDGMAIAATAPLAICRAALLAVMEDDK